MVDRAVKGGYLQKLIASSYNNALERSIEVTTRATQKSAVNAWQRFCGIWGVDWLCIGYVVDVNEGSKLLTKGGNTFDITAQGWTAFKEA